MRVIFISLFLLFAIYWSYWEYQTMLKYFPNMTFMEYVFMGDKFRITPGGK